MLCFDIGFTITEDKLVYGQEGNISCTTDVALSQSTVQWLEIYEWGTTTLVTSTGEAAILHLGPVTLDMHGAQYMCRITGPYGVQERLIVADIQSESDNLMVLRYLDVLIFSIHFVQFLMSGALLKCTLHTQKNRMRAMTIL